MTSATPIAITPLPLVARQCALAAAAVVLALFGTFVATGIGQDPLQSVWTPDEYTAILLRNPPVLRTGIGLDNLFIVLYSSMFLAIGTSLWDRSRSRTPLVASLSLLAITALLDLLENMHFMTMLSAALQGIEITRSRILLQVWESLVKFHCSYLGLFLLSFALPAESRVERLLCIALRWVQLPVGLLIYLTPPPVSFPLVIVRFTFFFFALLALASIFGARRFDSGAPR